MQEWNYNSNRTAGQFLHDDHAIDFDKPEDPVAFARSFAHAVFDSETPCLKFHYAIHLLRQEIKRSLAFSRDLSVMVVAVDSYSKICEKHGNENAKKALAFIGSILGSCVRQDIDIVGRYVNERFVLILPETGPGGALTLAERIIERVSNAELNWALHRMNFSVSIGIAYRLSQVNAAENLILQADMACESVEKCGGNRAATSN
ncbi:MAG: GGDEF domain-containing protein [Leptolyngbya sp.]|nr:GGDEF domain-containing protein [Candidatus Melainabacteria bacterium]